ncbi:hypothetical protein ACFFSH_40075 [Streptomyces filamentosus]|uniref:Uncharacterized protein n=1 Tax=Streptomyces filamentosus TaxID=67294 RepID=A0A919BUG0_STRFL|nr:hypothetical protein [Streptomyces filamentosus]GHG15259.1 hypothetical protein GCM10017667_55970 [Streptomyces filamentosus]
MVTTMNYGSWFNHQGHELTIKSSVITALGDYGNDYDVDAIADEWAKAINDALPTHVFLTGDEFIGPAYEADKDWEGDLDIKEIIEGIDFWEIVARYEFLTLDAIGRDELKSQAKEPAKAASKAMSRLSVQPHSYRPHPDSGRPQAIYLAGDVREALASRPGQGARTDKAGK